MMELRDQDEMPLGLSPPQATRGPHTRFSAHPNQNHFGFTVLSKSSQCLLTISSSEQIKYGKNGITHSTVLR